MIAAGSANGNRMNPIIHGHEGSKNRTFEYPH